MSDPIPKVRRNPADRGESSDRKDSADRAVPRDRADHKDPLSLIERFAEEETTSDAFLAPYLPGAKIAVRIKGVVYQLKVGNPEPLARRGGFGLFRISKPGEAEVVEAASKIQADKYLRLLPRLAMVLIDEYQGRWWALQANASDTRIELREPVPVQLVDRGVRMEQVWVRFDGCHFWYESANRRRDASVARKLRDALNDDVHPDEVKVLTLTPSEHLAYRILYLDKHPLATRNDAREKTDLERMREALVHAGANLDAFWDAGHGIARVRYTFAGQTHTANVNLADLTLVTAGVCLQGRERDFDLASLVGVMEQFAREGYPYDH